MKQGRFAALLLAAAMVPAMGMVAQHHDNHDNHGPQGGNNFHFQPQDRSGFQQHYKGDVNRFHKQPNRRPNPGFRAGGRIPNGVRFRSVPSSYYRGLQPPPPGYRYGYYNGYVVAYDPTTQIIADVLDLIAGN